MGLSIGIVGLPNIGKSTIYNALTREQNAESANYPFCTIEPNKAVFPVPDVRLDKLAEIAGSKKTLYAVVDFVDGNFTEVFNYDFTSNLEADMKKIESGDVVWHSVVDRLYRAFEGKSKKVSLVLAKIRASKESVFGLQFLDNLIIKFSHTPKPLANYRVTIGL